MGERYRREGGESLLPALSGGVSWKNEVGAVGSKLGVRPSRGGLENGKPRALGGNLVSFPVTADRGVPRRGPGTLLWPRRAREHSS